MTAPKTVFVGGFQRRRLSDDYDSLMESVCLVCHFVILCNPDEVEEAEGRHLEECPVVQDVHSGAA